MFAETSAAATVICMGAHRENVPPPTCNTYVPAGTDNQYLPLASLSVEPTVCPSVETAVIRATTGLGAQGRSGVATGQLGPAVTTPPIPAVDTVGCTDVGVGCTDDTVGCTDVGCGCVPDVASSILARDVEVVAELVTTVTTTTPPVTATGASVGTGREPAGEMLDADTLPLDVCRFEVPHPTINTIDTIANTPTRVEDWVDESGPVHIIPVAPPFWSKAEHRIATMRATDRTPSCRPRPVSPC